MRSTRGVVHALRNIHAALAPEAILVDTQPLSARPPVASDGVTLGTLDLREWLDTIQAVDERFAETVRAGLYELQHESRFVVTDTYDDRPECLEVVRRLAGHERPRRRREGTRGYNVAGDSAAGGSAPTTAVRDVTACGLFDQQASQQPSPRQLSRPSLAATAAMTRAVSGSAHHQPTNAFAPSPSSSAIER